MISKNEIHAFQLLPTTVTSLAKKLNVSPAAASKITEKLIINNLATKHRNGKTMLIEKEKTTLAQKLEEIITIFPRLPLEKILTHTNLTLIASMNYPLTVEELGKTIGVTRQWIHKTINQLSTYGIILKTDDNYTINPIHKKIYDFTTTYLEFQHYRDASMRTNDAIILWQHGNEFLFKTKQNLTNIQKTAVTTFSDYDLPLVSNSNYYYTTKRQLTTADVILHTILIDPTSKTYNAYALLLLEKTMPTDLVKKARLYNLTTHIQILLTYLRTHTPTTKYLPACKDYETLTKQYGVRKHADI
jgi:predicted transcriptional regulator